MFDVTKVFDDDYLYFYERLLSDERSDEESELIRSLGPVGSGDRVLDVACGHGRIANRLAESGASVVGIDQCQSFLDKAHVDAIRRGVSVEYAKGDMSNLPWSKSFDIVINWFTSFGYFDDRGNLRVLEAIHACLKPKGRVLIELIHGPQLLRAFSPSVVFERDEGFMVDLNQYDALSGRVHTRRTVARGKNLRKFEFSTRIFAFPELRDWLFDVGFQQVEGFGMDGKPLTDESPRMIVRAVR